MGQALYRKYRSKSFDDVVGQDHITSTLKKAIASGRIRHAYLFTGPRGVGKTSVARILAHEVSGLKYSDESIHLDIIEIDAASNRRIDEIRELRDKVHISPTSAKYKVYIIDEVHMLTREAFNALLKTLEEPPAHCIFILATTEAHKLPETITSRTQKFEFKPIAPADAVTHLAAIAKDEGIKVDRPALELLAEHGDGSFRDSISLLDQLASTGELINEEVVREFLGLPPENLVGALVDSVEKGQIGQVLVDLDELLSRGADAGLIAKLVAKRLRQKVISEPGSGWAAGLLKQLIEVPASYRPEDLLEISLLEAASSHVNETPDARQQTPAVNPEPPQEPVVASKQRPAVKATETAKPQVPKKGFNKLDDAAWEAVLNLVKSQAASIYTALRLASPELSGDRLILAFQFPLHQKKVDHANHRELIGRVVAEVTGQQLVIETVVQKSGAKEPVKPKKSTAELENISNIFGQAEVLES